MAHSKETRAKIAAAMRGNKNNLGWKRPAESRARIAAKMLGNKNKLGHKDSSVTLAKRRATRRGIAIIPSRVLSGFIPNYQADRVSLFCPEGR
jgi:hypothetical protein